MSSNGKSTPMTSDAASRIQSATAKSGGDMSSGGFPARAQAAGDRNANAAQQGSGGQQGGNTRSSAGKK